MDIAEVWSEAYGKRRGAPSWAAVEDFISGRLLKWFGVMEATAQKHGKGSWVIGSVPTYVDFLLCNLIE